MKTRTILAAAALAAGLFAGSVLTATGSELRTGEDAFGSWRDDAPGVMRLITENDLAAAAKKRGSSSNGARVVSRPDGAILQVPDGFAVEQVASGMGAPRTLVFAPNGDLFVANSFAGQIIVIRFGEDGRTPRDHAVFADDLDQPYGMAFHPAAAPNQLYVATTNGLLRLPYDGGKAPTGPAETLFDDIATGGHWTRSIAFSPDGRTLYYSVGSGSNVALGLGAEPSGWRDSAAPGAVWGDEAGRALVYAMDAEGGNRRVWATGLRNCSGLAVQPQSGTPWCAVNERDGLGDNIPFDYATSVTESGFYGWPWFYIGAHADPRHGGARADLADTVTVPDVLLQSHSAPLNLAFYDSPAWGEAYRGDAFLALHGSWNRGERTGYKIVRLHFENGEPTGVYEDFVTGFVVDDASVWGRPVGVAVAPNGDLYFSEDGNGSIWRVRRTGG